ncbi:hypothetical protein BG005_002421 [Podila minutissima]|nr:hypothetical protein BG005_002421 [Podila minutissima]
MYSGIMSLRKDLETIQIGWVGELADQDGFVVPSKNLTDTHKTNLKDKLWEKEKVVPIFLDDIRAAGHYEGYCKTVLWPLFHYILWDEATDGRVEKKNWDDYVFVNQQFADAIVEQYQPGDIVRIRDYHLLLVPHLLRQKLPGAATGVFIHAPFPSSKIFRCLPMQTYSHARHFISCCTRVNGYESTPRGVDPMGSTVWVGTSPIGIDAERVERQRDALGVLPKMDAIRKTYKGKHIIVGRDKLDLVKGVQQKLQAFEKFLNDYPDMQGKVVLIQVTSPPLVENPKLEAKIAELVAHINGTYGSLNSMPVHHYHQHIDRDEYYALLSVADRRRRPEPNPPLGMPLRERNQRLPANLPGRLTMVDAFRHPRPRETQLPPQLNRLVGHRLIVTPLHHNVGLTRLQCTPSLTLPPRCKRLQKVVTLRFSSSRWAWLVGAAVLGLLASGGEPVLAEQAVFNVRSYGATGNGFSNDTAAINSAITAANAAGGGVVQFPPGTYRSSNSIHMKSDVTIQLDAGSTIMGSDADDYDPPESNQWDDFQDYGHSHFHNAMIWGDRLTNIAFVGSGTIDGGGHLITGDPDSGQADKIISLTRCDGLTVSGITLHRGGHFAMLINGCKNVVSDRLRIDTASDRDGWNIISTTNVKITNADISANDDALAFKSDYALGAKLPNGNVTVEDAKLSAVCCNALMFGSETCGDFTGYNFSRISINGSNKSGLGLVSMDGAKISEVHYRDITMTGVRSPIMQKVGTRRRCGNNPGVGSISNITYTNITATGASPSFSSTLWGESGGRISDVTFDNVNLRMPDRNETMSTNPPSNDPNKYNPNSIGTRPAYGWYLRYANNIKFLNSSVRFNSNDDRPAIIASNSGPLMFDNFIAQRGSNSPHDIGIQSSAGVCATNARDTNNNPLRYSPSTPPTCGPSADFSLAVQPKIVGHGVTKHQLNVISEMESED